MSVALVTEHDENIYNVTKPATTYHKKSPRYKSIFRARIQQERKCNKNRKSHETMGRAREPLPKPCEFLKKRTWKPPIPDYKLPPECEHKEKPPAIIKKAPTPVTAEALKEYKERLKKIKPPPNYVIKNIKDVLKAKPKEPVQRVVIERYGTTKELTRGLEPQYIYAKTFGKTPMYLQKVIDRKQKYLQDIKDKHGTEQPKCRYITREERENLLAGLKQNWEELQKNYQGLPILTDTIPKMNRKSKMEADLKQLEKDIVLIERHPYIYVYDDDDLIPSNQN